MRTAIAATVAAGRCCSRSTDNLSTAASMAPAALCRVHAHGGAGDDGGDGAGGTFVAAVVQILRTVIYYVERAGRSVGM